MINYEKIRENEAQFLSLTSLSVSEFDMLLDDFSDSYDKWIRKFTFDGKPRLRKYKERSEITESFTNEMKFFFILKYLKENKLQESLAADFDMKQDMANKWIHVLLPIVEKILKPYRATRQGVFLSEQMDKDQQYLADCTVRTVQRDSYAQEIFYDGKKKDHTIKNFVITNLLGFVIFLSPTCEGKKHDKKLAEEQDLRFFLQIKMLMDLGFQGLTWGENVEIQMPHKKPRKKELSDEQNAENQQFSSIRVGVEHGIGGVKRLRIVKDTIRIHDFYLKDSIMVIAVALHNFRRSQRICQQTSASCA